MNTNLWFGALTPQFSLLSQPNVKNILRSGKLVPCSRYLYSFLDIFIKIEAIKALAFHENWIFKCL